MSSSGLLGLHGLFDHAHDVALLHDQEIFAIELDLGTAPLAKEDSVADLDPDGNELTLLVASARAHCNHLALRRLFLSRVGDDDATRRLVFRIDPLDHNAVMQ